MKKKDRRLILTAQLLSLFLAVGVVITVECKAYAKNILVDRQRRLGLVKFELKVGE